MSSAKMLLDNGSVVREIRYIGLRTLPQRMKRHKQHHEFGDYWSMHFDAPPSLVSQLNKYMQTDHRVVRWTTLKLGERLTDVASIRQNTITDVDLEPKDSNNPFVNGSNMGLPGGDELLPAVGSDAKVASLGRNDMVASLGTGMYGRQRL